MSIILNIIVEFFGTVKGIFSFHQKEFRKNKEIYDDVHGSYQTVEKGFAEFAAYAAGCKNWRKAPKGIYDKRKMDCKSSPSDLHLENIAQHNAAVLRLFLRADGIISKGVADFYRISQIIENRKIQCPVKSVEQEETDIGREG